MSDADYVVYVCPEDKLPAPLPTLSQIDAAIEEEGAEILYQNIGYGCTLFRYSPEFLRIRLGYQLIGGIRPSTRIFGMFQTLRLNYLFSYVILDDKIDDEFRKETEEEGCEDADGDEPQPAQPST
ncbi:unnamed protein product [Clonostachys solani]|uniref:Uncharacterized protein n=1 Tax=Clonostachys solani TaxID=160281 RepID=A0A9N9W4M1_9HYPO|nr:unnamed protein product [Clonostachys solani]